MQKTEKRQAQHVQQVLKEELARLKKLVPFDEELTLCWTPRLHSRVSGEVVGSTIFIYEEDLGEAVKTLRHEYLDCLLTRKLVDPLVAIINTLMKMKERDIYKGKERIVNTLSSLIGASTKEQNYDDY